MLYMYVHFQLKFNAGKSNRSLFSFPTLTNLLFDRRNWNEKRHIHWKVETCRFHPANEHLTSCQKYHQSFLTMPGDVMFLVRSALKTYIRERFISLSFKQSRSSVGDMNNLPCPGHVTEIPQWGSPVAGVHGTCPICHKKGRLLQIHCLRCRQMRGASSATLFISGSKRRIFYALFAGFGHGWAMERVVLLLRWATRGQMSPASQSASEDNPLERQRPYGHRPL